MIKRILMLFIYPKMMKNHKIHVILFLIIVNCFQVSCQTNIKTTECEQCAFELLPIIDLKLCLGMPQNEVSVLFNSFKEYKPDARLIDENTTYIKVEKSIILPNKKHTKLNGNLKFIDKRLSLINLMIPISEDYKHLDDLKSILKERDKEGLNKYIYESKKNSGRVENNQCTKTFLWRRNFDNMKIYEINIKIFVSGLVLPLPD